MLQPATEASCVVRQDGPAEWAVRRAGTFDANRAPRRSRWAHNPQKRVGSSALEVHYALFEIEDFKDVKQLRIDLDRPPGGPVYTLVGLNESGKTTILEAINCLSYTAEDLDPL